MTNFDSLNPTDLVKVLRAFHRLGRGQAAGTAAMAELRIDDADEMTKALTLLDQLELLRDLEGAPARIGDGPLDTQRDLTKAGALAAVTGRIDALDPQ